MIISRETKGFTIFEMLIVLAIIISLSLVMLANYRNFTIRTTLDYNAEKIVSVIRKAQIWSLTGQLVGGVRPAGGFGVSFSECTANCSYIFFADLDGNRVYNSGSDQLLEGDFSLDSRVIIQDVSSTNPTSIVFMPPLAQIYFNNLTSPDSVSVTLQHKTSLSTKTITVNRISGQINVP